MHLIREMEMLKPTIRDRYFSVLDDIDQTATKSARNPAQIRLVVVTKSHPVNRVLEVVEAGARDLGENYLEDAMPKIEALKNHSGLHWHMIGHVQSRKSRMVASKFEIVHSIDREKIAMRLNQAALEIGRVLPVLLECNTSGETTKFGWPAWDDREWSILAGTIARLIDLPGLEIQGLMTIAPFFDKDEPARPYFRRLRKLRDDLASQFPELSWKELSMGMSGDYRVAIQEGATILRIGTLIMGSRTVK